MANSKRSSKKADKVVKDQAAPTAAEEDQNTPEDIAKDEPAETAAKEVEDVITVGPDEAAADEIEDAAAKEPLNIAEDESPTDIVDETGDDNAEPDATAGPPAPVTNAPVTERQGGFVPLLMGGVVAGAIGFGAAYFGLDRGQGAEEQDALRADIERQLGDQSGTIDELGVRLETLSQGPDLSEFEAAQSDLGAAVESLATRVETTESQITALDERLSFIEKRPIAEGASDAAVAAYERELKALQDAMSQQRAEIEAMTADARNMEDNAEEIAQATMRRAALTRIQTALDTGAGFAPALADLEATGIELPAALVQIADEGAPSLSALQEEFPDAARAALSVSRQVAGDTGGGISGFLKTQLAVRSLDPREGDDPDAVLSRAEAAIEEGRLTDALAEIEALPEEGRAELSDWSGKVARRLDAVAAVQTLGENLN